MFRLVRLGVVLIPITVACLACQGADSQNQKRSSESTSSWVARKLAYEEFYKQVLRQATLDQGDARFIDPDRPLHLEIASSLVVSYGRDPKMLDTMVDLMNLAVDSAVNAENSLAEDPQFIRNVVEIASMAAKTPPSSNTVELARNERITAADPVAISRIANRLRSVRSQKTSDVIKKLTARIGVAISKQPHLLEAFASAYPVPTELQRSRARVAAFFR